MWTTLCFQGSESEDEEYHKKKKRSQSKSPSERSSSGESGEWPWKSLWSEKVQPLLTFTDIFCLKPERSYKKSKKHKKKTKKRRHKSVSRDADLYIRLWVYMKINVAFVLTLVVWQPGVSRNWQWQKRKREGREAWKGPRKRQGEWQVSGQVSFWLQTEVSKKKSCKRGGWFYFIKKGD